jgi:hypothetical protein
MQTVPRSLRQERAFRIKEHTKKYLNQLQNTATPKISASGINFKCTRRQPTEE